VAPAIRNRLFLAVYYSVLPIGYAQAWLAAQFRQQGAGLGWPLLIVWWPLRQIYVAGYQLCCALLPSA
jgi:hypothetical protein